MATQSFTPSSVTYGDLGYRLDFAYPSISSAFRGSAARYLQSFNDGLGIALQIASTSGVFGTANDDLSSDFEQNGQIRITSGSQSFTVSMGGDTAEPYFPITSNAASTAFLTWALANHPTASTYRLTLILPDPLQLPAVDNRTSLQNESLDETLPISTLPHGGGGVSPLTHTVSGLPPGLSFDSADRQLSGTPTTAGTYTGTYTVTDSVGATATRTFTWTITPDLMPTAPTISNKTGQVGMPVGVGTPVATGGNSPLTYTMGGLPPGLSFRAFERVVSGTPTTAGTYTVTYTVTDFDGDADSSTFTWTIQDASQTDLMPTAPNVLNYRYTIGDSVSITFPVGSGGDPPLTYSIGGTLPAGLSFNASTRTLSGTPTAVGLHHLSYIVTDDDGDSDFDSFNLTIAPVDTTDSTPTLPSVFNQQTSPGEEIVPNTFHAGSGGNPPLTYTMTGLPPGLSFDATTRTVTGTIPGQYVGMVYTVTYTVTDDDGDSAVRTFTWTVLTPPSLRAGVIRARSSQVNVAIETFIVPDGSNGIPPRTVAVTGLPPGLSFNASTREVTGTPTTTGAYTVTHTVTDSVSATDDGTFVWTITSYDPSQLPDIANQTIAVGQLVDLSFLLRNTAAGFSQVTFNLPPGIVDAARSSADGFHVDFDGRPTIAGSYDVAVTVYYRESSSDPQEIVGTINFTWTITTIVMPPSVMLPDNTITDDDAPPDPVSDTGVPAAPRTQSLPYSGRIRLTPPSVLGPGSPLGQQRAFQELTIGLYRSSGGAVRQAGQHRLGESRKIVTPGDDDPQNAEGYRVFTGEVSVTLHDLFTDPTATVQIEQHEPRDLEITYISMDIEHED